MDNTSSHEAAEELPLHDFTLQRVSFEWDAGEVILDLIGPVGPKRFTAHGVVRLSMPRNLDWGPSVSINHCRLGREPGTELRRLAIEMQTGDLIELVCADFGEGPAAA